MVEWKLQDNNNYIGLYENYILRVEKMGPQKWWWAVYRGKEELCPEKPFARKKDYAMKMAEECAEENIEPYVSDDFQIGPNGAFEYTDDIEDWDNTLMDGLDDEEFNDENK